MIKCSPAPASIIKAAMLAQIYHDLPVFRGDEEQLGLFGQTDAHDADRLTTSALIQELAVSCSLDASWLLQPPGQAVGRLVAANLRYVSPDRAAVIFAALEQALRYGPDYCLCGLGGASRLFLERSRAVGREIHRMLGFIRFQNGPGGSLIARPRLYHITADLILRRFAPRYPDTMLILLVDNIALILEQGQLRREPAEPYLPYVAGDEFAQAWETYYQSQYIAARKNLKLAGSHVPRKYWDWLDEGRILRREALSD